MHQDSNRCITMFASVFFFQRKHRGSGGGRISSGDMADNDSLSPPMFKRSEDYINRGSFKRKAMEKRSSKRESSKVCTLVPL